MLLAYTYYFGILFFLFIVKDSGFVSADSALCWPFNFVPYSISPDFTPDQRKYIKRHIQKINRKTCIYWADKEESENIQNLTSFVRFQKGATRQPCVTNINYPFGNNPLKVEIFLADHCFEGRLVLHEIVHALGFDHEQQRLDRDCYVWVSESATPYQRKYIKRQIEKINKKTCIYWADKEESENIQNLTSFVRFSKRATRPSCSTRTTPYYKLGDSPVQVEIFLADHCFEGGVVLHEIVHALGFDHEQQRLDRDCYVWVSESAKKNYNNKITSVYFIPNLDRFPYDKESVMHYKRSSDLKSLSERWYEWEPLGNREERLTDLDLWKIQYRFCGRPHYCEVHADHCRAMEKWESEMNCNFKPRE